MTKEEWIKEAQARYGEKASDWKFRCPSCHGAMSVQDYCDAAAKQGKTFDEIRGTVGFSCVGRLIPGSPDIGVRTKGHCNYAGGGLIGLNPVEVDGARYFDFADKPLTGGAAELG